MWLSKRITIRRECKTACSSRRRSRSCAANWKRWSVDSGFQCCDSDNRVSPVPLPLPLPSERRNQAEAKAEPKAQGKGPQMPADVLPLRRIDHIRFFVGNAKQSAYFYRNAFGFDVLAYEGLETGSKHEAGYVLKQGDITFVVVSSLTAHHPENNRLLLHPARRQNIAPDMDDWSTT